MNAKIRSLKYWGSCWRYCFLQNLALQWTFCSEIFANNTFALNLNICPSGPPRDKVEESAAHHLLIKRTQNNSRNHFWQFSNTLKLFEKLTCWTTCWAKDPEVCKYFLNTLNQWMQKSGAWNTKEVAGDIIFCKILHYNGPFALRYLQTILLRWTWTFALRAHRETR